MAFSTDKMSGFRSGSDIVVPVNARRYLTECCGSLKVTEQDVVVTEGVWAAGGGYHIPPEYLGIIRKLNGKAALPEDQDALNALGGEEQGSDTIPKPRVKFTPKPICRITEVVQSEEEEGSIAFASPSSPDSVAPAATVANETRSIA